MKRIREQAVAAVVGLPIWWVGWQLLDAMKGVVR